jgi:hypothetical protein
VDGGTEERTMDVCKRCGIRESIGQRWIPEVLWLAEIAYDHGPQAIQFESSFTSARRLVESGDGEWRISGEFVLFALNDKGAAYVAREREKSRAVLGAR